MLEKSSGAWSDQFFIHPCRKSLVLEKNFSGIGKCVEGLLPGPEDFPGMGECKQKSVGGGKCSFIDSGLFHPLQCKFPMGS